MRNKAMYFFPMLRKAEKFSSYIKVPYNSENERSVLHVFEKIECRNGFILRTFLFLHSYCALFAYMQMESLSCPFVHPSVYVCLFPLAAEPVWTKGWFTPRPC